MADPFIHVIIDFSYAIQDTVKFCVFCRKIEALIFDLSDFIL
jgi:hypothetical protein